MSGTLQVGPHARALLASEDYIALRQRVPDGYLLKLLQDSTPPPYGARLFDPQYRKVRDGWGRTPREAAEAVLADPDACHWCGRDVSDGDFVNVQDGALVVRCCSVCWEKAE